MITTILICAGKFQQAMLVYGDVKRLFPKNNNVEVRGRG